MLFVSHSELQWLLLHELDVVFLSLDFRKVAALGEREAVEGGGVGECEQRPS